jgi:hypothetical protein
VREIDIQFQARLQDQRREFEQIKTPLFDQLQRATRENEALQRELDRQQDQTRKMLSQFQ